MGGIRNSWTPERDAELKKLFEEGYSFELIAEKMGTVKNACIGRAHRLKLGSRSGIKRILKDRAEAPRGPSVHSVSRRPAITVVSKAPRPTTAPERPKPTLASITKSFAPQIARPIMIEEPEPVAPEGGIGFMEQRDGLCRWPISKETSFEDFRACGCKTAPGKSYCDHHRQLSRDGNYKKQPPVVVPDHRKGGNINSQFFMRKAIA